MTQARGAPMWAFAALAALLACVAMTPAAAHPTHYPRASNASCFEPEPAEILSYHVHLLYWGANNNSVAGAMAIREQFIDHFNLRNEKPCHGLFHQGRMCMEEIDSVPAGPFVTAEWSAFFLPENITQIYPWAIQHRGEYDILIHPNSGCEIEDHTIWAGWLGKPWDIDTSAFSANCPGCTPWSDDS
mmetsp:Transcript_18704/g.66066  ORF Transcript_18704/g.66066 Transcript_18704/m.66066 type:complete len:187 (-) Transcript_18704:79-639(-)